MPGYKDWIDAIDIKVDYFSAFMKAWIAFNAWYNNSGEVLGKNDKERIEFIGGTTNRFKTYVENLLSSDSIEGNTFRENVAALHTALISAAITTQEYIGVRQTVSFSEVAVKNSNANERFNFRNVKYECSRAHGKITTVVTDLRNGSELLRFEQEEYSIEALIQQSAFLRLTNERKKKCKECYTKLTPYKTKSVIANTDQEGAFLPIGAYRFVLDPGEISQSIVIILYMLRCCLAHGDFLPDESANTVYQYAYQVLCAPLKKLR